MSDLLKGQLCLILGVANKWSLAYAVAEAFSREGADIVLGFLGSQQKTSIEAFGKVVTEADHSTRAFMTSSLRTSHELSSSLRVQN